MMSTTDRQQQGMDALHRPPMLQMATAEWWRCRLTKEPAWWAKVFAEPFAKDKADG